MRATAELSPGTLISDRYLVKRTLGYGSCGCTYLVNDKNNSSQPRVIKEFAPADNREAVIKKCYSLFEQEAEVLCKLRHPQIPQCFGFFEENERLFLVQEYIDGKTYCQIIQDSLTQGRVFSPAEVLQWLVDLLPVLDYIHSCRIVHRDISPDNIMFPNKGDKPVLIDFGVVKQVITQIGSQIGGETAASIRGTMVGKTGYSPPEQLRLGQCYPNSDLYSLAVTALVLMTGKHPSELCDGYSLKWQWRKFVKLSTTFDRIFDKMLAEIPKDRYQSAREVLMALSSVSLTEGFHAVTVPHPSEEQTTAFGSEEDTLIAPKSAKNQTIFQQPRTIVQIEPKAKATNPLNRRTIPPIGKKRKRHALKRWMSLSVIVVGSLIGGWAIGERSPNLALVCDLFNNCADGKPSSVVAKKETNASDKVAQSTPTSKEDEWQEIEDNSPKTEPFVDNADVPVEPQSKEQEPIASDREELTEKVKHLQTQLAQLLDRQQTDNPEEQKQPTVKKTTLSDIAIAPESESTHSTDKKPKETNSTVSEPSRPRDRNNTDSTRSTPKTAPTPSEPRPAEKPKASAPEPSPTPSPNSTPEPQKDTSTAQTYQPGYWQPVARLDTKRPFRVQLINQTSDRIEYALTTNEFSPRHLAVNESTTLTHVPLDANLLVNSIESSTNKEYVSSLQFHVSVANNLVTVKIRSGGRDRAGDSTINIDSSGAIYIF